MEVLMRRFHERGRAMSEEYQKYEADEPVIYTNGDKVELGIVKRACGDDEYFVNYHTGDTAARTHARHLSKLSNRHAYHIFRLDPDGKERKKIVGTTTVDKAFERFMLDACPEVKKKLQALEIIKKSISDVMSLDLLLREMLRQGKINQDEFFLLREVMK